MLDRLEVLWLLFCLDIVKRTDGRIHLILRPVDIAIFGPIQGTIVLWLFLYDFLCLFVAIAVVLLRRGAFVRFIEVGVGDLWGWRDLRVAFVHDVLEGSESVVDEIEVQRDEPKQEDRKYQNHKGNGPICHHLASELPPLSLSPQQPNSYQIHQHVHKHRDDHDHKRWVIFPPNAVIDPNAMMVEPIHASKWFKPLPIADLAVSRCTDHVAFAVLAVETRLVAV